MHRIASALLLGGGVLLTTWVVSVASPPAAPAPVSEADVAVFDQSAPVLAEMSAQVARLRERLASPPEFPVPERDPFRFGRRPEPTPPQTPAPSTAVLVEQPVAAPAPSLPRVVAVIASATDGGLLRTAVLASGDDVQIVRPGDASGQYIVRSIGTDVVELVDPVSGATFRIVLR